MGAWPLGSCQWLVPQGLRTELNKSDAFYIQMEKGSEEAQEVARPFSAWLGSRRGSGSSAGEEESFPWTLGDSQLMQTPIYQAAPLPSGETLPAHLNATSRDPDGARQQDPGWQR